jgi:glycerol-3-phosphate dehydrogenase (NAD(P)+)
MKIGVVGLGNLGSAIASLIASNDFDVLGWEHHADVVDEINHTHTNARFLPGVDLHPRLSATKQLDQVVAQCEAVFVALPSAFLKPTLDPVRHLGRPDMLLINLAKGIDRTTGLTALQMLGTLFPNQTRIMLSGPSIANEFARGMPTVVMIAGARHTDLMTVARILDNAHFRVRFSDDPIGVELGGVLKNAYVIGLGMFDGQQIASVNFRSVYLTLALEEMSRVGVALGARAETFAYLAGMGDLLATALSPDSHNRRLGVLLGTGHTIQQIEAIMGVLPEGYSTIQTILLLAEKLHVSAPLAKGLWDVINGRSTAERFIQAFIRDFVD